MKLGLGRSVRIGAQWAVMFHLLAGCGGESESEEEAATTTSAESSAEAPSTAESDETAEAAETNATAEAGETPAEEPAQAAAEPDVAFPREGAGATFGDLTREWVELQRMVETGITTSRNYRDDETQVAKLTDGDLSTAWNSATMDEGDTTPQRITVTLPEGVRVHSIGLTPGYTKPAEGDRDLFMGNRRLSAITIRHGDQTFEHEMIPDEPSLQDFDVEGGGGEWVIELTRWQDGERPDWREIVVSELRIRGEVGDAQTLAESAAPDAAAMRSKADDLLRRYHREVGSDRYDARALAGEPVVRSYWVDVLANPLRIPVVLPAGKCYAIAGFVERRYNGREDQVTEYTLGDTGSFGDFNRLDQGSETNTFMLGLDETICARNGSIRQTLEGLDEYAVRVTFAIFEQSNDPEAREEAILEAISNGAEIDEETDEPMPDAVMAQRAGLHLTSLVLTDDVIGREPNDRRQIYSKSADDRVYCFFTLENPASEATQLELSWLDENGESRREPSIIEVPAQRRFLHYRYTSVGWRRPGRYRCVIREGETELGSMEMSITE